MTVSITSSRILNTYHIPTNRYVSLAAISWMSVWPEVVWIRRCTKFGSWLMEGSMQTEYKPPAVRTEKMHYRPCTNQLHPKVSNHLVRGASPRSINTCEDRRE